MKSYRKFNQNESMKIPFRVEPLITIIVGLIFGAMINRLYFIYIQTSYQVKSYSDFMSDYRNTNSMDQTLSDTELHHLVFGIRGSIDTWNKKKHFSDLWWVPNSTRGYVWFENSLPSIYVFSESSAPYKVLGSRKMLQKNESSTSQDVHILKETMDLQLENFRWFVFGEDDTVFFVQNLVTVLNKYDHNQMYYIGGLSESVQQNLMHSHNTAFSGGGYAISFNLAKEIANILHSYENSLALFNGRDLKLQDFITELGISLTLEKGFHQIDLREDIYGFLAAHSVAPLVSLHHLDDVKPAIPGMSEFESLAKLNEAYKADPGRTLQQCFCFDKSRNWTISVSWGYTVQIYADFLSPQLLEKKLLTFRTRDSRDDLFTFDTRPAAIDSCDHPVIYFASQTTTLNSTQSLSIYKRFTNATQTNCKNNTRDSDFGISYVNVLAPTLGEKYWRQVPRRQCCEVVQVKNNELVLKIRRCKLMDNVIPS